MKRWLVILFVMVVGLWGCVNPMGQAQADVSVDASAEVLAQATFAGGCFWCMEKPFDQLEGVISTTSGYTGGDVPDPSYQRVSSGTTGHAEAVQVTYDPAKVSYEQLLAVFWRNIDPVDAEGQFCDRGTQYRTSIFYHTEAQRRLAEASKQALQASGQLQEPIETDIVAAPAFYPAEDYHQDYYLKSPLQYKFYRLACGRDRRLAELWGNSNQAQVYE
jgi:peptide-methionine (S)-S-oxide reductase